MSWIRDEIDLAERRSEAKQKYVTFHLHAPGQFHVRIDGKTIQTWDRVQAFKALQALTDALAVDVLCEKANKDS